MPRKRSDPTDGEAVTPETGPEGSAAPESEAVSFGPVPEPAEEAVPELAEEAVPEPLPEILAEPAPDPVPALEAAGPAESSAEPDLEPPRVEPLRDPPPAEEHHEEHHEEEAGPSFAARALTFLLLLLAGAALGIWGAPKLAPLLPSGLAPVSAWLTPGVHEAEARVDALQAQVGQELGDVQARVAQLASGNDLDTRIAAAVQASESRIGAEITGIRQELDQADDTDARQRLAKAEAALQGQSAELNTLKQQLSGAAASGQLSEEAVAKIDVYQADIDGLRAEMGALQDRVAALGSRIDEVAADADRQITTAQTKVNEIQAAADTRLAALGTDADLALIRAAVAGGQPFEEPLSRLAARPGMTVPAGLTAAAPTGVATLAALRDSFPDAAHEAIQASILASAGEGIVARSRAFIEAQMASRSLAPKEGVGPDAVLSRMEDRLRHDDLVGTLTEAKELPSEAAAAMGGWLSAAQLRADAVAGLAELDSAVPATN